MAGVKKPHTGHKLLSRKPKHRVPIAVMVGMTLGQYTSQGSVILRGVRCSFKEAPSSLPHLAHPPLSLSPCDVRNVDADVHPKHGVDADADEGEVEVQPVH